MKLFVVKRGFKSLGKMYNAGSIITDPADIKLFKTKLKHKQIVEVTEENKEEIIYYFKARVGIDLTKALEPEPEPEPEPAPAPKKATVKVKAVKK